MSRANDFKTGLTYLRRGIRFFADHKRLWPSALVPTIINLAVFALFAFLLYHYYSEISQSLFGSPEAGVADSAGLFANIWGHTLLTLIYTAKVLIFVVMLIITIVFALIVSAIFTGWFNEILSAKVENILLGGMPPDTPGLHRRFWRSTIVEIQKGLFFIIGMIIFLILGVIPLIGNIVCLVGLTLFGAFFLGFNFVDYPMNRRLWKFGKRLKVAWPKRYFLTGFGTISLIPIVPFLLSGPLVAGGTILFHEAISDGNRPTDNK